MGECPHVPSHLLAQKKLTFVESNRMMAKEKALVTCVFSFDEVNELLRASCRAVILGPLMWCLSFCFRSSPSV